MKSFGYVCSLALLASASNLQAHAAERLITFTQGNFCNNGQLCTNNAAIDGNYGSTDEITAVLSSTFDSAYNGPLYYYERGFGDLVGVAYSNKGSVDPLTRGYIMLSAKSGFEITLKSFDLGCFNNIGNCQNVAYNAMPGGGEFLTGFTNTGYPGHRTINFASGYGSAVRIWFGPGENLGIDNIRYDVRQITTGAVPEPVTWTMMMLGFGGIGSVLRRRHKIRTRIRFA